LIVLFAFLQHKVCWADNWQVVMHKDSPVQALDRAQVYNMFMGNSSTDSVFVVDRDDYVLRTAFYQQIFGFNENRWRAHWSKLVFTAQGAPPPQLSTQEILNLLRQSVQAVAYFTLDESLPVGVKQVFVYTDTVVSCELPSCFVQQPVARDQ
jgi:hypothetical protein